MREKLISQTSMKKEVKLPTPQPAVSKPLPKPEEEALEISTFRSLDELSLDEEPAIIRISNEKTQEEPMFRSPQEFSDN